MLIEVIKENEVVSCRLTTGEELVARLKKDKREDGYVELDTPLIVRTQGPDRRQLLAQPEPPLGDGGYRAPLGHARRRVVLSGSHN